MKFENVSEKSLGLKGKTVEPGETVEKSEENKNQVENFVEEGYLKEVASGPERASGDEDEKDEGLSEREKRIAEGDYDEELVENSKKLEGIGGSKAKEIGLDFENWEHFKEHVSKEYLEDLGLREDQIEANLENLEDGENGGEE